MCNDLNRTTSSRKPIYSREEFIVTTDEWAHGVIPLEILGVGLLYFHEHQLHAITNLQDIPFISAISSLNLSSAICRFVMESLASKHENTHVAWTEFGALVLTI